MALKTSPKLIALSLTILLVVLAFSISVAKISRAGRAKPQASYAPGTLDWYAQEASNQGQSQFIFNAGLIEYSIPETWDDVLADYSFVVVQPIQAVSYPSSQDRSIKTWYRFRIIEVISQKPVEACEGCPPFPSAPADFVPQAGELVMSKAGGRLTRNGVELIGMAEDFPDLLLSQTYLLVLDFDASSQVGHSSMGPAGVYTVSSSGLIEALHPDSDPFDSDLSTRYGNSIDQLRVALGGSPPLPPPPPSSCDPDGSQRQSCINRGGFWYSENCYCEVDICLRKPWLCN